MLYVICINYNYYYLSYGIIAWGVSTQSLLKRPVTLQKKSLRTISRSRYNCHTEPLFKKFKLLKFCDIFKVNCCKLFYRSKIQTLPQFHCDKLPTVGLINPYTSRSATDVYVRIILHSMQKQSLNYTIGSAWNTLPSYLKEISDLSLHSFSKRIKAHLITQYNEFCNKVDCFSCHVWYTLPISYHYHLICFILSNNLYLKYTYVFVFFFSQGWCQKTGHWPPSFIPHFVQLSLIINIVLYSDHVQMHKMEIKFNSIQLLHFYLSTWRQVKLTCFAQVINIKAFSVFVFYLAWMFRVALFQQFWCQFPCCR
jgi:hypothetical protein